MCVQVHELLQHVVQLAPMNADQALLLARCSEHLGTKHAFNLAHASTYCNMLAVVFKLLVCCWSGCSGVTTHRKSVLAVVFERTCLDFLHVNACRVTRLLIHTLALARRA